MHELYIAGYEAAEYEVIETSQRFPLHEGFTLHIHPNAIYQHDKDEKIIDAFHMGQWLEIRGEAVEQVPLFVKGRLHFRVQNEDKFEQYITDPVLVGIPQQPPFETEFRQQPNCLVPIHLTSSRLQVIEVMLNAGLCKLPDPMPRIGVLASRLDGLPTWIEDLKEMDGFHKVEDVQPDCVV